MTWADIRKYKCRRCQTPCELQHDDERRSDPESRCPIGHWNANSTRGKSGRRLTVNFVPSVGWGAKMWHEMHERTKAGLPGFDEWLTNFSARLPLCGCQNSWSKIVKANPPSEPLFEWGVARHNDVNRALGKSEFSLQEAVDKYDTSPTLSS